MYPEGERVPTSTSPFRSRGRQRRAHAPALSEEGLRQRAGLHRKRIIKLRVAITDSGSRA